jgi:predicted permease
MLNDVRYAVRMLLKTPGFTAVAVFTLALGIGANTAIFSLIDTVLLKMLPVKNPEQLVLLHTVDAQGNSSSIFSYPLYQRLRDHNDVFSGIFVASSPRLSLSMEGQASPVIGELVSGNYFSVLEVHPILGRALTIEDDRIPGAHPVAVISHIFWKNRFELSPSVVGKAITLNGASFTIIGVTPPEFFGETVGRMPEVWIPMMMQSQVMPGRSYLNADDVRWLHMMARIKLGVVEKQVRANLNVILRQYLSEIAGETKDAQRQREILNQRIEPTPGSKGISELGQQFSQPLLVLMAVVGLVLLISCANVANLLLARATVRQKEIAIRLAMGAGRLRLVRQLLIESVSLATLGGVVALLLAYWGTNFPLTLMSHAETPVSLDLHPDVRIFGFTGAISLIASFVFGLAPAFLATRVDLAPALKENPGTVGGSGSGSGLGRVLVIAQVAASLVVLIGAGLFVRSLQKLGKLDAGFDRENVLVLGIDPEASGYDNAQLGSLYRRLLERASTLPGVHSAALSDNGLFDGSSWTRCCVSVEGHAPGQDESRAINADLVTPDFGILNWSLSEV